MSTARRAVVHSRLRWLGAPLLLTGASGLFYALFSALGGGAWFIVALGALGTGLGLASFGANHDTAMAFGFVAMEESDLPAGLRAEVDEELQRDRAAVLGLRPSPRAAIVVPLIAIGLQSYVWWTLVGGAG